MSGDVGLYEGETNEGEEEELPEVILPPGYGYPEILKADIKESLWMFEELCFVPDKKG